MENFLIESALWLTGKTMGDMEEIIATNIMDYHNTDIYPEFSIEKFCYYLLSPEFIEKYCEKVIQKFYSETIEYYIKCFWRWIYMYQSWKENDLINLLSKIK